MTASLLAIFTYLLFLLLVTAYQTLDRPLKELREAFFSWIPIRRHTKEELKELAVFLREPSIATGTLVGLALGALAAPVTFGASLVAAAAGAGIGAAVGAGMSLSGAKEEKKFNLAKVQVAIDKDREALIKLQGQLDSFNRTLTSTTSGGAIPGITVRSLSDALTRISQFADSSVLPRDITQLVKSSLERNQGSTSPIVNEIWGILYNLECPTLYEVQVMDLFFLNLRHS